MKVRKEMEKQKFHLENWQTFYNARIDEDDVNDTIESGYDEGQSCLKVDVSDDKVTTVVKWGICEPIDMSFEDVDTGEEIEIESDVTAYFNYTVVYKIDVNENTIEEFEEALNDAIESGQSTFEIEVPVAVVTVKDVEITEIEDHGLNDSDVARIAGGESAIFREIKNNVERGLYKDESRPEVYIRPSDKEFKFICIIPTE